RFRSTPRRRHHRRPGRERRARGAVGLEADQVARRSIRPMSRPDSILEPAVDAVVDSIRRGIESVAASSLVGLYVFGSVPTGDFEAGVSDVDLIAVLSRIPTEELAVGLKRMHERLVRATPEWEDRIEVIYISQFGLAT